MKSIKAKINLTYNKGFQWDRFEHTFFIGYAWQNEKSIVSAKDLYGHLSKFSKTADLLENVASLNGVFSFVFQTNGQLFLYSDKSRFFPIFYNIDKEEVNISDDFYRLKNEIGYFEFEPTAKAHFLAIGFTPGNKTLIKGIKQVKPAEMLSINTKDTQSHSLYKHAITSNDILQTPYSKLKERAKSSIDTAFDRFFKLIGNSPVLLPLSGGFDSRLIGAMLKDYGFKDVTCFTFGRPTKEVEISRKVAKELDFDWHFIEYTNKLTSSYKSNNSFQEYVKYASRGNSMFYLQEYPAMQELKRKGLLEKGSYVIPGHAGDVNGGSMITKTYPLNINRKKLVSYLIKKRFIHSKLNRVEQNLIRYELDSCFAKNQDIDYIPYSLLEEWEYLERLPKYIFNSSHVFDFFELRPIFPFWDKDLVEFFKLLPFEYRQYQKLNHELLREAYFAKHNIDFNDDIQPSGKELILSNLKQLLRPYLPDFIKIKLLVKNDWVEYGQMTELLKNDITTPLKRENGSSYLNPILEWYLYQLEK